MSFHGNENAPGCGSGGVLKDEELEMGRFGNDTAAVASHQAPLFKPGQLKAFRGSGFELIPLNAWDALDAKGRKMGKAPGKGWRDRQPLNADDAAQAMVEGRNVGVRLRARDLIVDVDPRNFPEGIDPFKQLQVDIGISLSEFPTVVTGSGGLHIYMRKPDDLLVRDSLEAYPGVEFKAFGRQVVAPGSIHPDTGRAYLWDDLGPVIADGVPDVPDALVDLIRRPERVSAVGGGEIDAEQLAEMLTGLDAEDYRDQGRWLELMMACHHATAGEGREEFVAWSTSDALYSGHDHVIGRRWDSLHADRQGGVTIATLYKRLHDAGRGELIPRIRAEEDFADPPEESGVVQLAAAEVKAKAKLQRELVAEWVYLVRQETYLRRSDCSQWSEKQFRAMHQPSWKLNENVHEAVIKGKLAIRKVEEPVYEPGLPEFLPDGAYNIWRDSSVPAERDDDLAQAFLDHVDYLIPHETEREYLLDYLSFLAAERPVKVHFATLIYGPKQGTGKSYIAETMKRMLGRQNIGLAESDDLKKEFTAWQENCQLGVIEELMDVGRLEIANRLKTTITNPDLRIRPMYKQAYWVRNRLNLIAFTNHADALRLENSDRRWLILHSPVEAKEDGYYQRLFGLLRKDDRFVAAVRWMLQNRDAKLDPKGRAPSTEAKVAMRDAGKGDVEQYLDDLLQERSHPLEFDLVRLDDVWEHTRNVFRSERNLRKRVGEWLKGVGAVQHDPYAKGDRPRVRLWSLADHERWAEQGPAGRVDAFLDHASLLD